MNKVLEIIFQYSQLEYLTFVLSYVGVVSVFFVLSTLIPSKFSKKEVYLSTTSLFPYILFFATQIKLQYFFGNQFSFTYSLLVLVLMPVYVVTMLFGMNEKSWIKVTLFALTLLITLVPLVYTNFIPLYPAITFTLSYLLSVFFLILFLKRYHA